MWKNSWSSADAASRSVCDWGLKGLTLDERSGPVSQVQPTPQPFLKLQELFVFMWSGQINEVKWRSLLSGLCWNGFGVRCRCTWFLGAGKQLFIVVASLSCHSGRKWTHSCQVTSRATQSSCGSALEHPGSSYFWPAHLGFLLTLRLNIQSLKTSAHSFYKSIFLLSALLMESSIVGDR